ncbi:MAG: ABC transporter ATP-binding protein [Firmicutes bacterium]|nr:ABC transporter ATP-binding protein [Bacillota bacterium]
MGVKLVDVTKIFTDQSNPHKKVVAVNNVSLDVNDGELVSFLGPSGCGKTTTLRIVSGFEYPTSGEVWISGQMVNDIPPNKRDTSMVFQSYAIFPHLSVAQNVGFGLELKGRPKNEIKEEVEKIMDLMNLKDMGRRRPDQLSGGQQQRVALARAIINKPSVLLFDEPLSNLDAKLREQMRLEIRRIQQSFGITSIYVTHDQAEAMTVSDRIVVMNEGNIMQTGTPFEIYSRPANRFVADFIGRVNFFTGRIVSADGDVEIEFSGGGRKSFSGKAGSYKNGQEITLAVRPESLRLKAGGGGIFTGTVAKSVYLGQLVEYEIDCGGEKPVLAVTYDPADQGFFKTGDKVGVDFSAPASHILP